MIGGVTTWEIIWTGGVSYLNGLPHLPAVTHLHVNKPLFNSYGLVHTHGVTGSLRVFTGENVVVTELKLSNVRSFIIFRSGKNLTSFNKNKVNILLAAVLDLVWQWNVNARTKQKQQRHGNRAIWLVYWTDTNARGFWLVKRPRGWKNFMPENSMLYIDVILQHDRPIEQCLQHIKVLFGGKTKSPCFEVFIHWLIKQMTNTYRNHFLRSYENPSIYPEKAYFWK